MGPTSKRVEALGRPRVWIGSTRVSKKAWGSKRAQELFFLLINHPAGLSKDTIVGCLFPETDAEKSEGLFHSTLYRCRKALGRNVILWEEDLYHVKDVVGWSYDVADFEALVKRARRLRGAGAEAERVYRTALQLYEGEYLEGWVSEWCEPIRVRLRQLYVEAVLAVAGSCAGRGQREEALEFYRSAIAQDHYSEVGHKGLVDCYLAMGDRLAAMRHYLELVERLKEDVPPEARSEIPALVDDILGGSVGSFLSAVRTSQHGREAALRGPDAPGGGGPP